jgi:UDP-glucose 4-epimerase
MAEQVLDWYRRSKGFRSVSLRYFNAAGASLEGDLGEDWTDAQTLVPRTMKAVMGRSGPLTIFGTDYPTPDGTAIRDYIHVLDLADAHAKAVRHVIAGGDSLVLNLGTGTGSSVREVIAIVEQVTGRTVPIKIGPRRAGDAVALWADATHAGAELAWHPRYTLREIVETAWRWHRSGPDGGTLPRAHRDPSLALSKHSAEPDAARD